MKWRPKTGCSDQPSNWPNQHRRKDFAVDPQQLETQGLVRRSYFGVTSTEFSRASRKMFIQLINGHRDVSTRKA